MTFSKDSKCDYCGETFGTLMVFAFMVSYGGAIMHPEPTYCSYSPDHKHSFKKAWKHKDSKRRLR